jgi:hypothetical protein
MGDYEGGVREELGGMCHSPQTPRRYLVCTVGEASP